MTRNRRGDRGSRTRDPRTGPVPARSAPAPPDCRTPCACRWRPPPAIPACPPASRSSQQLEHLPQRPRRHLAAHAYPRPAGQGDLDRAASPCSRARLARLRHNLHRQHRGALRRRGGNRPGEWQPEPRSPDARLPDRAEIIPSSSAGGQSRRETLSQRPHRRDAGNGRRCEGSDLLAEDEGGMAGSGRAACAEAGARSVRRHRSRNALRASRGCFARAHSRAVLWAPDDHRDPYPDQELERKIIKVVEQHRAAKREREQARSQAA